jgi:NADH-quinone oxidoreductase subunit D
MGPQHPSTHGVLKLVLTLDGEIVRRAVPHIGFLHRALEKIAENRTYLQFIPVTDRFEYLSSMSNNLAYCLAVEKLAGIPVPPRAEYIRVLMAELNRLASHLMWLSSMLLDLGATTPFIYAFRERELIMDIFEMTCGARLTYNYIRFGGVSQDLPAGFSEKMKKFIPAMKAGIREYNELITENPIFLARTRNIGLLDPPLAVSHGVSGPSLRGSGIAFDIRRAEPYSVYSRFSFEVPTGTRGDAWDRYLVRMKEMEESVKILEQALEGLPGGRHRTSLPQRIKPPRGEACSRIEAPRGDTGVFLVSDGSEKPWRLKFRAPSFSNLSVLPHLLRGGRISDIMACIGSLDIILPEIDR